MFYIGNKYISDKHDQFEKIGSEKCDCEKCYFHQAKKKFQKSLEEYGIKSDKEFQLKVINKRR